MDQSICIWSLEPSSDIWTVQTRLGLLNDSSLGFYGARWSPDAKEILAHGHFGAFYRWKKNESCPLEKFNPISDQSLNSRVDNQDHWNPVYTISGHFDAVRDVAWNPSGNYFISVR